MPVLPLFALFGLGCVPRYADLPPIGPGELWTPLPLRHTRLELPPVGLVDVAYVDSGGPGAPLVFVHGLSSSIGFWEYQLPAFAASHRVIALDLPGYGASGRPDAPCTPRWYAEVVRGLLDALELPRATLVGHSMGGQIALTLALAHPSRVDRLVLSAPAGFERFDRGAAQWMKSWWHEERALQTREEELRHAFTGVVFNRPDAGVERLLEERVRMAGTPAFAATSVAVSRSIAGMLDEPVVDRLGEVRAPTLVVFGSDDRMIPNPVFTGGSTRRLAERGVAALPDARLVVLPGAGHTVHHDDPAGFNRAVADFLSLPPSAP
jgi:pimeloyl-ACP methyl ester carboxylesterase